MSRAVLIMGTNGSGKSSVMREILGTDYETRENIVSKYVVNESTHRIAVGKYSNDCGGCDTVRTVFRVYNQVDYLCRTYPEYDVFFEGVLLSGVFNSVANLLMELSLHHGRNVSVNLLWTDPYTCVSRVLQRNGGKQVNQSNIVDKCRAAQSTFRKHRDLQLYECRAFDTTRMTPQEIARSILIGGNA